MLSTLTREIGIEDRIKIVGEPLKEVRRGIRVMKDDVELLTVLNSAVERFVGTLEYQRIYTKWYGDATPFWTVARVTWAMGTFAFVLLATMTWWRYHTVLKLNRNLLENISNRERAEEAARELNEHLERRVEERTEELRESEMRLRDAVEALPVGFALYDREDHLVMCNEGYRQQVFHHRDSVPYGAAFEEILNDKLSRGHYLETEGREAEWLAERLRVHHETSGPIEQMHSNGHWYWINERRISDGSIVVVSADITERKRLESGLLRRERLATLGQLTATVSHELRNPLAVIRTSVFVVRDGLNGEGPRVQRSLERIERSIVRCDRIIDELLDFTRISEIEAEPTPIDAWLEESLNEQTLPSGVALRLEFGMPDMAVPFDRDRFRRAIINVFENDCQAMIGEGREDTGPGIPADVYGRIFEPLYSTKGFGVGLGLPVVKQIMDQHGGGIEIESEEGRGTRVCLWLPTGPSAH